MLDVEESSAELIEAVTFQLAMAGKNGAVVTEKLEQHGLDRPYACDSQSVWS